VARVRVEYVGRRRWRLGRSTAGRDAADRRARASAVLCGGISAAIRAGGDVRAGIAGRYPMPEGRPYSLGSTSADMASINATRKCRRRAGRARAAACSIIRARCPMMTTSLLNAGSGLCAD